MLTQLKRTLAGALCFVMARTLVASLRHRGCASGVVDTPNPGRVTPYTRLFGLAPPSLAKQAGMTMVELLIVMAICVVLAVGAVSLYTVATTRIEDDRARQAMMMFALDMGEYARVHRRDCDNDGSDENGEVGDGDIDAATATPATSQESCRQRQTRQLMRNTRMRYASSSWGVLKVDATNELYPMGFLAAPTDSDDIQEVAGGRGTGYAVSSCSGVTQPTTELVCEAHGGTWTTGTPGSCSGANGANEAACTSVLSGTWTVEDIPCTAATGIFVAVDLETPSACGAAVPAVLTVSGVTDADCGGEDNERLFMCL